MPMGNVFTKIDSEYYQLTSAEKKVADYASRHQQKTQYMSISELAEEAGVAEATISRFCRRLDYKGYNAFKLAVANLLEEDGWLTGSGSGYFEMELEDEKVNPKHAQMAVKAYLQRAGFSKETAVEIGGMEIGIYE